MCCARNWLRRAVSSTAKRKNNKQKNTCYANEMQNHFQAIIHLHLHINPAWHKTQQQQQKYDRTKQEKRARHIELE